MKKNTRIRQISKKSTSKLPDLYDKLQEVAKNIEQLWFFLFSYLVCSQIWLNHPMDEQITSATSQKCKKSLVSKYSFNSLASSFIK
jgi:hypothetical protein